MFAIYVIRLMHLDGPLKDLTTTDVIYARSSRGDSGYRLGEVYRQCTGGSVQVKKIVLCREKVSPETLVRELREVRVSWAGADE